jgi:hypothetical protein
MREAGTASAVLGNHEFNAIAWATPNDDGGFLRKHSEKNASQHAEFLSNSWKDRQTITMPLIDFGGSRYQGRAPKRREKARANTRERHE